ncbi:MAG: hypothetical protein ACR2LN_01480 [Candidatus Levyibacteriota bacterium]
MSTAKAYKLQGILTILGGILMILGIYMPWVSLFGGLQTFAGIVGLNGKILLATAVVSICFGLVQFVKKSSALAWILGILGLVQGAFCGYLLFNLFKTVHPAATNGMNSMMAIGFGPGLFITTIGASIIFIALVVSVGKGEKVRIGKIHKNSEYMRPTITGNEAKPV